MHFLAEVLIRRPHELELQKKIIGKITNLLFLYLPFSN
jgi:hypothetical protein